MIEILENEKFKTKFVDAMASFNQYYWAVAWAGKNFDVSELLFKNQNKMKKIAVGLHFYQTHPYFIKRAIQLNEVKFIKQPEGTFHTKTYLFLNDEKNWVAFIGSANFTKSAFTENTETMIMITSESNIVFDSIMEVVNQSWEKAKSFTRTEFSRYKKIWAEKNKYTRKLMEPFVKSKKDIKEAPVKDMSWNEFIEGVKEDKHGYKNRIDMMNKVQEYFKKTQDFGLMDKKIKRQIAGFAGIEEKVNWGWFGSMMGAGLFKKAINDNDQNVRNAINAIPFEGKVSSENFKDFVLNYKKTFKSGSWMATATRLLATKRPDVFVCLDNKNKRLLSQNFAIKQSEMSYERYWDEIIGNIEKSKWWNDLTKKNEEEAKVYKYRAAFLDALYYEE